MDSKGLNHQKIFGFQLEKKFHPLDPTMILKLCDCLYSKRMEFSQYHDRKLSSHKNVVKCFKETKYHEQNEVLGGSKSWFCRCFESFILYIITDLLQISLVMFSKSNRIKFYYPLNIKYPCEILNIKVC